MSDIKNSVGKAAKAITKGSGTIIKTASLSIKLSSEESGLKSIYTDIGRAVHDIYKHGGSLGGLFDEKYAQIVEAEAKIAELKEKIEIAKGTITCGRCKTTSKRESAFCQKCGEGLGEITITDAPSAPAQPVSQVPPPSAQIGKICNVCGSSNGSSDRFCLSCGRIM